MQSIETILKQNAKYRHLYEVQYLQKPHLIAYKTIGADNQKQAKAGIKNIISIVKHY